MDNTLLITLLVIFITGLIVSYYNRRVKDKCLKDFSGFNVVIKLVDKSDIVGRLKVFSSALEIIFNKKEESKSINTYVIYKTEFLNLKIISRALHLQSPENLEKRKRELKRAHHPGIFRRLKRRLVNMFKTLRDSILEMLNVFVSKSKSLPVSGTLISTQEKYIQQLNQNVISNINFAYEPVLEKYVGKKVVVEVIDDDHIFEYIGILKDYTANFIELLDVEYLIGKNQYTQADLIIPRRIGAVRSLVE